jgi:hypothetical protein
MLAIVAFFCDKISEYFPYCNFDMNFKAYKENLMIILHILMIRKLGIENLFPFKSFNIIKHKLHNI